MIVNGQRVKISKKTGLYQHSPGADDEKLQPGQMIYVA
jgi:hypothetical protein